MRGRSVHRHFRYACAALILTASLSACHHEPTGSERFSAGRAAEAKHDTGAAIKDFSAAIALKYDDARVYYDRAQAHRLAKEPALAEADYSEALRRVAAGDRALLPKFVSLAHYQRGILRINAANWAGAKADMLIAVGAYPNDWSSWDNLGYARFKLNDFAGSIPDFNRGLALFPKDWSDHYNRGYALYQTRSYAAAIRDLTSALTLNPQLAAAYNYRGESYFALKNYPAAEADLTQAIHRIPKANAWEYRCEVRESEGHIQAALSDCNHAIADYPRWAGAYIDRGWAKAMLGANAGALADMNAAIKIAPRDTAAYTWRGWVRQRLSQYRAAFGDFRHALRLDRTYQPARNDRQQLGTFLVAAQQVGERRFGIANIDVAREENQSEPNPSEYQKRVKECGGYFGESDDYFDDCVEKGPEAAKNDESADTEASQEAQAENYDVANRVEQEEAQAQEQAESERAETQAQNSEQASSSNTNENESSNTESSGSTEQTEQAPEPVEEAPAPVEEPQSSGE